MRRIKSEYSKYSNAKSLVSFPFSLKNLYSDIFFFLFEQIDNQRMYISRLWYVIEFKVQWSQ